MAFTWQQICFILLAGSLPWLILEEIFQIKSSAKHSMDILNGKVEANTEGGFGVSMCLLALIAIGSLIYFTGK
jgi:hypothetical protein